MAKKDSNPSAVTSDKKWMEEDDLRTLLRAEEIRRDPERYKAARSLARNKLKEMGRAFGGSINNQRGGSK